MSDRLSFERFLQVLRDRWKLFAAVAIVAAVASAIISGLITPRYRSSAIVYPVNLTNYSIETRSDQLLQLLESNSIRDTLIKRFDLVKHYRLDTNLRGQKFALYNEFKDRVEVSKTRYESVQIEVTDEDPRIARDMVQMTLDQTNLLARRLQREKSAEVLAIASRTLKYTKAKLDSVETRLAALRNSSGLLSYENQAREFTKAYAKLVASGASQGQKDAIRNMMKELEEKGGEFRSLTNLSDIFRDEYSRVLTEYEHVMNDMTKELTYTNTVVYPEIPDKKIYPVRWLIVLVSVLSSLFLCFLFVLMREGQRSAARR
jgi:capsule polysaccharide export protein KpsE/RkpR